MSWKIENETNGIYTQYTLYNTYLGIIRYEKDNIRWKKVYQIELYSKSFL